MRWTSQARFHLEMALMKILQAKRLVPIEELISGLGGKVKLPSCEQVPPKGSTQLSQPPSTGRFTAAAAARMSPETEVSKTSASSGSGLLESIRTLLAQRSPMIASLLEHAAGMRADGGRIEIRFAKQDRFSFEMLQSADNLELMRELAESITGTSQSVCVTIEDGSTSELPRPGPAPASSAEPALLERVRNDSGVKAFLDVFSGEIADVKELK
jgi:hypothetical protein